MAFRAVRGAVGDIVGCACMTFEEINGAANQLYRDPCPEFVRAALCDALAEMSPAMTWAQWLNESETLARLAECMVAVLNRGHGREWPTNERLGKWLETVGWAPPGFGEPNPFVMASSLGGPPRGGPDAVCWEPHYAALATCFGVPPIVVEVWTVGDHDPPVRRNRGISMGGEAWDYWPVAPTVALAVLRMFVAGEREGPHTSGRPVNRPSRQDAEWVRQTMRRFHPGRDGYQIRLGEERWDSWSELLEKIATAPPSSSATPG